jgi:hypothetical protein
MPRVRFTPNIQRHVSCPTMEVAGGTLREVLDRVFERNPQARGYILDEQGSLRKHMIVFIGNQPLADRAALTDPVQEEDEIYVSQALSGG